MELVMTILRVVAVVSAGLLAGIFFGYRAGVHYAIPELTASSFVQLQQTIHVHYVRFMPPLVLTALLSSVLWLVTVRAQWRTAEFWLVAISAFGILVIAAATRAVNVPLNNQLMTSFYLEKGIERHSVSPWLEGATRRVGPGVRGRTCLSFCSSRSSEPAMARPTRDRRV